MSQSQAGPPPALTPSEHAAAILRGVRREGRRGAGGLHDRLTYVCAVPQSAFGPALNEQGYCVGRVERNLYWVTDGTYQSAFLTTADGVVRLDAPPTIGHNLHRAVDEIAAANGVSALMLVDIVDPGWAPVYLSNLTEDVPGYIQAPATALTYPGSTSSAATSAGSARVRT